MSAKDWPLVSVLDLLETMIGGLWGDPPGENEQDVTVARATEFRNDGSLDLTTAACRSVTKKQAESRLLKPTDILLEKSGGGPKNPVGRVVRVPRHDGPLIPTNFVQLLRPNLSLVDDRYLFWLLWKWHLEGRSVPFQTATTNIRNLKTKDYLAQLAPLPTLDEQERIITAIEEHLSHIDAGCADLERASRNLSRMRRSILLSVVPDPFPSDWEMITVKAAGVVELGRQRAPRYHNGPNMRPYLRVANVFEDRLDLTDVKEMDFPPEQQDRYRLEPGDILLNEGQSPELVGRPAMYRGEMTEVFFTNSLIRFKANPGIDGEFALLVFRRHLHAGRFRREAQITTNIAHMAAGRFKTVEFPVPPLSEQRHIVAETHRKLSLVESLAALVRFNQQRSASLRRSVLATAFAGNLQALSLPEVRRQHPHPTEGEAV